MKRLLSMVAVLVLVSGCGATGANHLTSNQTRASNQVNAAQNNTVANSQSGGNQTSSGNDTNGQSQLDEAGMQKIAQNLANQYVLSHAATTQAAYDKIAKQMFSPGLYSFVAGAAAPGVDYGRSLKKWTATVQGVQSMYQDSFSAVTSMSMQFAGGKTETHNYTFIIAQTNNHWYITKIQGS